MYVDMIDGIQCQMINKGVVKGCVSEGLKRVRV